MTKEIKNFKVRKIDWIETDNGIMNVEHLMIYNISDLSDTIEFGLIMKPNGDILVDNENASSDFIKEGIETISEYLIKEWKKDFVS